MPRLASETGLVQVIGGSDDFPMRDGHRKKHVGMSENGVNIPNEIAMNSRENDHQPLGVGV